MVGVAKLTALGGAIATQGDRGSVPGLGSGSPGYRAATRASVRQFRALHGCL